MRKNTILAVRALVAAAFAGAVVDLPLPSTTAARTRIHLVDRSGSALVPGPAESLTPADAARLIAWDRSLSGPGDRVLWASFGADLNFESERADPSATDLAAALEGALARGATEIVLHGDGRGDPGRALLLCRERRVPVHAFPLGPVAVRDARIARLSAPADAAPGERVAVEVVVESSFEGPARLSLGGASRDIRLAPSVTVRFDAAVGPFTARLEVEDACPENNVLAGAVYERSARPRLLALSNRAVQVQGWDVKSSPAFEDPGPFAAVLLDNVPLGPAEQKALSDAVRRLGRGLLLFGGDRSYARGGWSGTALESLSPLLAQPDQRVAVLFAIDTSGSMKDGRLETAVEAVRDAWARFTHPGDDVAAMASDLRFLSKPSELRQLVAQGATHIAKWLMHGRLHLASRAARRLNGLDRKEMEGFARRHLVLLTDGEPSKDETPEMRRAEGRALDEAGIGLTVITVNRELEVGRNIRIGDWKKLADALDEVVRGIRETEKAAPGAVDLLAHPITEGAAAPAPALLHLTALRPGAQQLATWGRPPARYAAIAVHPADEGRVAAFAFPLEAAGPRLLRQAADYVAGTAAAWTLSIDPPAVRARPRGPAADAPIEALFTATGTQGKLTLRRVRSDLWEGMLPPTAAGAVRVALPGGVAAAAALPSPEYATLGVDRRALGRIASGTGGRLLLSTGDLETLPRPLRPSRRPSRPWCLAAALCLLFLDLGLTTFWKP